MVTLEEAELRELHEVFYQFPTGFYELSAQDPTDMCPPHAVDARWMNVFFSIRELMVVAVMGCPPDRTLLSRCGTDECEHELKPPTRLVAAMREVAVIHTGNAEHAHNVEQHAHGECDPTESSPYN